MIYQYSRYNINTGRFSGHGSNPDAANVTAREGEGLIEGHHDYDTQMVSGGAVVDVPAEIIEQKKIADAWDNFTVRRNQLLQSTDWTQVPDSPVSAAPWAVYRQELRDLPTATADPREVVWPNKPE